MKKELIDAIWDLNTEKVSLILNKETKKESNFENMENPLLLAAQFGAMLFLLRVLKIIGLVNQPKQGKNEEAL